MRTIEKVAAVVLRGGLLLVVRKRGSALFISPGGKPEPGERPEQTLARELAEETGLDLRAWREFGAYSDRSAFERATTVHVHVLLAEADGEAVAGNEIAEVAWIDGGYRQEGVELGSVFDRFVVPELLRTGLMRPGPVRRAAVPPADGMSCRAVVAVDLDGTIAFDGRLGPRSAAALSAVADRPDLRLAVATSRAPRGARRVLGPLADRVDDLVCCNGSVRVRAGEPVESVPLPVPELEAMLEEIRAEQLPFYVEYGDWFAVSGGGFPWMDYPDRIDLDPRARPDPAGVVKLVAVPRDAASTVRRLRAATAGAELAMNVHAGGVLDVTAAGVCKSTSLVRDAEALGSSLIAFGNDLNDHVLLGRADLAFVVGTGLPGLERAGHVRRIPATDAAVATALEEVP